MTVNLGSLDRRIRVVLGALLLILPFISGMAIFESGAITAVSVIAGLVLIGTSAMKFCPLYRVFGIRTCKL
ncbi:DUF2892 domain-containing protein [Sulfitobacter sp.]|uniref:YgaP family membrane protein n=1 Tax=Sulfitobacter sp. TaxID=1903071 RepID=UPI003296CDDA